MSLQNKYMEDENFRDGYLTLFPHQMMWTPQDFVLSDNKIIT